MTLALAIDFGSTYTKGVLVDLSDGVLVGVAQAPSTATTDVTIGLEAALARLREATRISPGDVPLRVASSSAAGGLRMAAIGLVPELTAEAARRAALGGGAKVVGVFSYAMSRRDLTELARLAPDIVLLAGGTDGGDRETLVHNAAGLAALRLSAPIIVAGNRSAQDEAEAVLAAAGCAVRVVDNVMPEIGRINVEPAQAAIRETFMARIVSAKGLDRAERFVGRVLMPTPAAVLEGATLLADGVPGEPGLGELLVLDVGGATTDVHSVGWGRPTEEALVPRGLPEPYAKRTVEGDLGIRINAPSILEAIGGDRLAAMVGHGLDAAAVTRAVSGLARDTSRVPAEAWEAALDRALARAAVGLAVDRHAGRVEIVQTPEGPVRILSGKDLRQARTVVGTGGVLAYGPGREAILRGALYDPAAPWSLRPTAPELVVDRRYVLFAAGLLAAPAGKAALRMLKRHLEAAGAAGGATA